jgi:uncharacterized protein YndB with AHSA1/START domain
MPATTQQRSVFHDTFRIERTYPAAPSRVFAAFSNPKAKRRWFAEGEGWEITEFTMDFRVGGLEVSRFRFQGGEPMRNDTVYLDIVPDRRIVLTYTMMLGETRLSASLATVEITPSGAGARLVYTEQGAYLDGADKPAEREQGCREMLDKLGEELARGSA